MCGILWNSFRKCVEKPTPFPRKFLSYQFSGLEMKGKPARSSSEWRSVGLPSPSLTQHGVAEVWNSSQSQHRVKYSAVPFTFLVPLLPGCLLPSWPIWHSCQWQTALLGRTRERTKKKRWGWSCDTRPSVPSIAKINPALSNSFIPQYCPSHTSRPDFPASGQVF